MTAQPASAASPTAVERWLPWARLSLDRLPIPYRGVAVLLGLLMLAEQVMEQALIGPVKAFLIPNNLGSGLALPILIVYMLLAIKSLKVNSLPELARLRSTVQISDEAYDQAVKRIIYTSPRDETVIFLLAFGLMALWFIVLRLPYPMMTSRGTTLPANLWQALLTLGMYTTFASVGLILLWSTWRFGQGLDRLSRQPLTINAFDPDNVLPFGRLSLRHSLTVAVTVLLLLIPLGIPGSLLSYSVLTLASLTSLSALILPLWGVHQQMKQARDQVATRLSSEMAGCQTRLMSSIDLNNEDLNSLTSRVEKLNELRSALYRAPAWPFRNAATTVRVVLAALSPLLYFILNEILRSYVFPVLGIQ